MMTICMASLLVVALIAGLLFVPEKLKTRVREMSSNFFGGVKERRQSKSTVYRKIRSSKVK